MENCVMILETVWREIKDKSRQFRTLLGIVILTSMPILCNGINIGHDLAFHLMRIEGVAKEISAGNIPVRISSSWMDGYGYPVSVFYGDILLYFPALLRIAGVSVIRAYKAYLIFINTLTVLVAFLSFSHMFRIRNAYLVTLVYSLSSYRLMNVYIRAAVGEYSAMAFLPLIAWAVWGIYTTDDRDWNNYRKNAIILTLGMTGMIETHILSTEMVFVVLLIVCITLMKKTLRFNTIKVYFLSIVGVLLINAWFLVPFLDYYINVPVKVKYGPVKQIQNQGVYILQLFTFFQTPYGASTPSVTDRMIMTPGIILMTTLLVAIVLLSRKKVTGEIRFLAWLSVGVLFLSSTLFPWDFVARHYKVGNLLAQVQFPWRYIGISTIILAVLLGYLLEFFYTNKQKIISIIEVAILGVSLLNWSCFLSDYVNGASIGYYRDASEINSNQVMEGEYLLDSTDLGKIREGLSVDLRVNNMLDASINSRSTTSMNIDCSSGAEEGNIILPMFNYKGYRAYTNMENLQITDAPNGEINVHIPPNFKGQVHVEFDEPKYWRISELISVFFCVLIFLMVALKKKCIIIGL